MFLCDLSKRHSCTAVKDDLFAIYLEWRAADLPPFQSGSPHSCSNPFDDEILFQFRYRADDNDHGTPESTSRVSRKLTNSMLR